VDAANFSAAATRGSEVEDLTGKIGNLQASLQSAVLELEDAAGAASQLKERQDGLRASLAALAAGRLKAAEEVGQLSKQQLAEIKHLAKIPPGMLRRLLLMLWLLLHGDRFRGRQAVQVDECRDWHRCQRMLADDGFVSHILNFDPSVLEQLPKVVAYIESCLCLSGGTDEAAVPEPSPQPAGLDPEDERPALSARSDVPQQAAVLRSPFGPRPTMRRPSAMECLPPGAFASSSCPSSPKLVNKAPGAPFRLLRAATSALPPVPGVQAVARASAPCGALIRWMRELLFEHRQRPGVLQDIKVVEAQLKRAQERQSSAEKCVASVEADIARTRFSVAAREAEQLRNEEAVREQDLRQRELGQLRASMRNEPLDAKLKKCGLEAEIVACQVRRFGKLGPLEVRRA